MQNREAQIISETNEAAMKAEFKSTGDASTAAEGLLLPNTAQSNWHAS
jgi:hypothetical protein